MNAQAQMKVTGVCFSRCIQVPAATMSDKEQECIFRCAQRLLETEAFFGRRFEVLGELQAAHEAK